MAAPLIYVLRLVNSFSVQSPGKTVLSILITVQECESRSFKKIRHFGILCWIFYFVNLEQE